MIPPFYLFLLLAVIGIDYYNIQLLLIVNIISGMLGLGSWPTMGKMYLAPTFRDWEVPPTNRGPKPVSTEEKAYLFSTDRDWKSLTQFIEN